MNTTTPSAGAAGLRHARLLRARRIRKRVVAIALALFVAVFLLITLMLVSGHDPALGRTRTAVVTRSSGASSGASSGTTGGASSSTGSGLSPVTSGQS
jgi:hypothetical protein